jgi:putative MATE family efflux protein
MSTLLCIALGGILTVAGLSLASPILHALNTPDDIIGGAKTYLLTMVSGTIVVTAYNMASAILRALGNGKTPLLAMVIAGILNIGLDFLFVFAFDWGIFGAAIASVISQFVSFLYCLFAILKIDFIKLDRTAWRFDWKVIKALLSLGTPIALEYVIISLGGIFLQSSVNLQGSSFIAGYTATNKVYGLLECSATSLGLACSTFLAQNYGASLYNRVKNGVKTSVYIAILMAVIVLSLTLLFRKYLLLLFLDVNQAGGYDALTIAVRYLTIMTVFLIVLYLIHVFRNSLQAIGIASWSFLSGISEFLCRVFMAKIAVHWAWLGSDALFVSEPVAWFGALLTVFLPYFYYRKKLLGTDGKNKNADNPVDVPSSEL